MATFFFIYIILLMAKSIVKLIIIKQNIINLLNLLLSS